jgi:histidinol-phosphate/aromatic aminotransferase/cobyric acid decarboxylase-like protein
MTSLLVARLQAATSDYQKLQADLSIAVEARQRLDAQLSENELVKKVRETDWNFLVHSTATLPIFRSSPP